MGPHAARRWWAEDDIISSCLHNSVNVLEAFYWWEATDQQEPKTSNSGGGGVTTPSLVGRVGSIEADFSSLFPVDNFSFAHIPPTVGAFRHAQTFGAEGRLILSRAELSIRHRTPILAVGRFNIDYLKTQKTSHFTR